MRFTCVWGGSMLPNLYCATLPMGEVHMSSGCCSNHLEPLYNFKHCTHVLFHSACPYNHTHHAHVLYTACTRAYKAREKARTITQYRPLWFGYCLSLRPVLAVSSRTVLRRRSTLDRLTLKAGTSNLQVYVVPRESLL